MMNAAGGKLSCWHLDEVLHVMAESVVSNSMSAAAPAAVTTTAGMAWLAPYGAPTAEYEAGRQAVALLDRAEMAALRLSGATRVDFIQRQTTNDVKALRPGQAAITVLTNPQARILDTLTVLARPDDFIILNGPPLRERLVRHLRGLIFFMDQVTVTDLNPETHQLELLGPQAAACLAEVSDQPSIAGLARFQWCELSLAGHPVTVVRLPGPGADAWRILAPAAGWTAVWAALVAAAAQPIGSEAYDLLRVEAGLPAPGVEMTDAVTPLEAGLLAYISQNKGCYTGQEIIARQLTYDKVTRHLRGLILEQAAPPGASVEADGRTIGSISSSIYSPALARPIALAFVKRDYATAGSVVTVRSGDETVEARVVDLPFTRP
jgi:folate-binding protein YgfZ